MLLLHEALGTLKSVTCSKDEDEMLNDFARLSSVTSMLEYLGWVTLEQGEVSKP